MLHQRHQMRMHVNHRDGPKATRGVTYMTIWHTTIAWLAPSPPPWVCLHTALNIDGNISQAQPAGIGACSGALAGSYKEHGWPVRIQPGEALRACGGHLIRLEVRLDGERRTSVDTKKLAENTIFYHLIHYLYTNFRSRPRPPANKTAHRGLY